MQENENIKVATKELEQISEDEVAQRIAELREKARRDDKALFDTGKRIGKEEALKEVKELQERIAELKEKARMDDKALFDTGKRIGKEEGLEEGFKQGLEQGSTKGQKLEKEKIAQKLLALNIPIEQISKATELSVEEIKNISNN